MGWDGKGGMIQEEWKGEGGMVKEEWKGKGGMVRGGTFKGGWKGEGEVCLRDDGKGRGRDVGGRRERVVGRYV